MECHRREDSIVNRLLFYGSRSYTFLSMPREAELQDLRKYPFCPRISSQTSECASFDIHSSQVSGSFPLILLSHKNLE